MYTVLVAEDNQDYRHRNDVCLGQLLKETGGAGLLEIFGDGLLYGVKSSADRATYRLKIKSAPAPVP